ncbi:MAG: ATP-binding protein [Promethearchaeati archaeon]
MSKEIKKATESNQFLSSLFNNMEAAVFLVDKEARVKNINKSFSKLFQKSEEEIYNELCGNAIGCIFPIREETDCGKTYNCNKCTLRKAIMKCFKEKGEVQRTILKREFYLGDNFYLKYFYIIANYFEYEENEFVLIIINDITEIESARERLKELNRIRNEFLGIAAHDLKSPISVISMASSYLLEIPELRGNNENKKLLELIQNSSNYMIELVNNFLDLSKIEAGELILDKIEVDYVEFVKEVLELNKIAARSKNINIDLDVVDNYSPIIKIDKSYIQQVINNLIDNAIKFSHQGSIITVRIMKKDTDMVLTEISDQGQGIPEKDIDNLFRKYRTSSVKTPNGGKSSGLGLAISKKIVKKHDGKIGVRSKLGKGSTFYFILPLN